MTSNCTSVKKNINNIAAFRDLLNSVLNDSCLNPLDTMSESFISFLGKHLQKIFNKMSIKDNLFITNEQKKIILSVLDFTPKINFVDMPSSSDDSDDSNNQSVCSLDNESDHARDSTDYNQYRSSPQYLTYKNIEYDDDNEHDPIQTPMSPKYDMYKPSHNILTSLDETLAQLGKPDSPTSKFDEFDKILAELDRTKKSDDLQTQLAIKFLENTMELDGYHYLKTANMGKTCKFLEDAFVY